MPQRFIPTAKPIAARLPPLLPGQRPTSVVPSDAGRASDREIGRDVNEVEFVGVVGVWYDVLSTYLNRIRFDWAGPWAGGHPPYPPNPGSPRARLGYLSVEFLDLAVVMYAGEAFSTFEDLLNSSSKGQYMHHGSSGLQGKPGIKIRGAQRKVTQAMKDAREPAARTRY